MAHDALSSLGSMVLALQLMPFVGDKEYLHVTRVNKVVMIAYTEFTKLKLSTGLSIFTTISQLECNVAHGYLANMAMAKAARLGRVDAMGYLRFRFGVVVSSNVCRRLAKKGDLKTLQWGVGSGAIPTGRLSMKVNQAALYAGQLQVFRWCLEQNRVFKVEDVERSVQKSGYEHVKWAVRNFPRERSAILIGISLSNIPDALELYKKFDSTGDGDAKGHFFNFLGAFRGCNIDILDHVVTKLRSAAICVDDERDLLVEVGHRLRYMSDNPGGHTNRWYTPQSMHWAKHHDYLRKFFY